LGLYQRLQRETSKKKGKESPPEREKRQERMRAYIRSRRRTVSGGGGYVTSEEIQEEQERHLTDLQVLRILMINGARGPNGGYRLAYLRSKYLTEYAHLRDIEISSR
jgi:hypothetical protein